MRLNRVRPGEVTYVEEENVEEENARRRIPVIGITGGIGSGKSEVMGILEKDFHAAVILSDLVAHDLMEPGAVSYGQIVKEFGEGILAEDGTIHRPALSSIVFADPDKLEKLNQITHPNVKKEIERRIEQYRSEVAASCIHLIAVEAALFIGGGYEDMLDELWYVYADEETRIRRLMKGRGYTEEKSRSIMKDQLDEETFRTHCDRVIDNSGTVEELRVQLEKVFSDSGMPNSY